MSILVTGGAGYIGSNTCVQLLESGYNIIILDNLINSSIDTIKDIELLTGKKTKFYNADVRDDNALKVIFEENRIDTVIHFAGHKSVFESVKDPIKYYDNNVNGLISLLRQMQNANIKKIIFSSSASVYGNSKTMPVKEDYPKKPESPYSMTKSVCEDLLYSVGTVADWNISILRYFNPGGAHKSGLLGEKSSKVPDNIIPYIVEVAAKKQDKLRVFGNDYETIDGTGIRDYIHITDLARGHLLALKRMQNNKDIEFFNLGTGSGTSVYQLISSFEKTTGIKIPYKICSRRDGDVAESYADTSRAKSILGFEPEFGIDDICKSSWDFFIKTGMKHK